MVSDRSRVAEWASLLGERVPPEYAEGEARTERRPRGGSDR